MLQLGQAQIVLQPDQMQRDQRTIAGAVRVQKRDHLQLAGELHGIHRLPELVAEIAERRRAAEGGQCSGTRCVLAAQPKTEPSAIRTMNGAATIHAARTALADVCRGHSLPAHGPCRRLQSSGGVLLQTGSTQTSRVYQSANTARACACKACQCRAQASACGVLLAIWRSTTA